MAESDNARSTLTSEMMIQYSAIGNDLRFYADQRFKIASAFLVANGLLANVAKDHKSFWLAFIGMALGYLCLSWDRYTSAWWWALANTVEGIEGKRIKEGKLVKGYKKYRILRDSSKFSICRPLVKASASTVLN